MEQHIWDKEWEREKGQSGKEAFGHNDKMPKVSGSDNEETGGKKTTTNKSRHEIKHDIKYDEGELRLWKDRKELKDYKESLTKV